MLYRTLLAIFICISPSFAAKKTEILPRDVVGWKLGKWESKSTFTFADTGEKVTDIETSISYLSKNKKLEITKGKFKGDDGYEGSYTSKISTIRDKEGFYKDYYEDNHGEVSTGKTQNSQ